MVQDWHGDSFPRQHHAQRYPPPAVDYSRVRDVPDRYRHVPPMEVADALAQHCGISVHQSFVAVYKPDGSVSTYFSPARGSLPDYDTLITSFFDNEQFTNAVRQLGQSAHVVPDTALAYEPNLYGRPIDDVRSRGLERHRLPNGEEDWDSHLKSGRKRPRARQLSRDDDQEISMPVVTRKGLRIGDSKAVSSFYEHQFKSCQQSACKLIAKAWIKVVEPKKQSTHPYTGRDEKAPEWWPKPWGDTKEDRVRHREPDHLYKRERVHLLIHILRLVVKPSHEQHSDIRKHKINVEKLEEATTEALSGWIAECDANKSKKKFINDIFRVAKMEERLKLGQIDANVETYVTTDDGTANSQNSENDESYGARDEVDEDSPGRSAKPSVLQHGNRGIPQPSPHAAPMISDLPMREAPFPAPGSTLQYVPAHQHPSFNESALTPHPQNGVGSPMSLDMVSGAGHGRRGSFVEDYATPTHGAPYQQQWAPVSTSSSSTTMYAYATHQAQPSSQPYASGTVPMAPPPQPGYVPTTFDGLSRMDYDTNGTIFRQQELASAATNAAQAYEYASHDVREPRTSPQTMDTMPRHHG